MSPYQSFAQRAAALEQMTRLESGVSMAVKMSRVPLKETKKLLIARDEEQIRNTPLFQFMRLIFKEVGLGEMDIKEVKNFSYIFSVKGSPIPKLIPDAKGKKTCYLTADAFSSFFSKDLGLPSSAKEIKCVSEGYEACEFSVKLNALQAYQVALDETDKEIIGRRQKMPEESEEELAEALGFDPEELKYRTEILRRYDILDENLKVTEVGAAYYRYRLTSTPVEEDFEPPWEMIKEISSAIAAARSFAEAMGEKFKEEKKVLSKEDEKKIVNIVEESKKSRSFAELISKQMKKDEKEE